MSVQRGRDILVKIKNESEQFVTLAGLRSKSIRLNASPVDVTHSDSLEAWRELLPGAGIKTADITGAGIFTDTQSDMLARTSFFEQSVRDYQIIIPSFGLIEGPFLLTTLSYLGSYQGEARYELSLASSGAPSFSAV